MSAARRALVVGLGATVALGGILLATRRARAAPAATNVDEAAAADLPAAPTSVPTPEPNSPEDIKQNYEAAQRAEYPWLAYSPRTLAIQQAINQWRVEVGGDAIEEDGILGPATCAAWREWAANAYYAVYPPVSCR